MKQLLYLRTHFFKTKLMKYDKTKLAFTNGYKRLKTNNTTLGTVFQTFNKLPTS